MDISKKELKDFLMDVQCERVESRMTPHVLADEQLEEWGCHLLMSRKTVEENVEEFGEIQSSLVGAVILRCLFEQPNGSNIIIISIIVIGAI